MCKCRCGADWFVRLDSIKAGRTCQQCMHHRTKPDIAQELANLGLVLLNKYTVATEKVYYICSCGEIGHTLIGNIRAGVRCGKCTINRHKQYFESRDCQILEYKNWKEIRYKCSCGNIHTQGFTRFKNGRYNCPACRISWNFNPDKTRRPCLAKWKQDVVTRDNFDCQMCNKVTTLTLHIHHIESYAVYPELVAETSNGITLCETCHNQLHSLYGKQVGRENLLKHIKNPSIFICLQ